MADTKIQRLTGNDLVAIYLDGLTSGIATAAIRAGMDEPTADEWADESVKALLENPMALQAIKDQIRERLAGEDSGPFTMNLPR